MTALDELTAPGSLLLSFMSTLANRCTLLLKGAEGSELREHLIELIKPADIETAYFAQHWICNDVRLALGMPEAVRLILCL